MDDVKLKRIGVLGTEDDNPYTSHIYAQWAPLMNPPRGTVRRTGMLITHVWDKDRAAAEKFARLYGIPKVVDRFDQMVGEVDGVVQSGYKGSFWSLELVRPYLEAGIPVFIDRPGAYSLARIRELVGVAAKHKCPLMVTNNHENNRQVDLLKARVEALGPLTGLVADSLTDRDMRLFSMHCIHGWYMIYPLLAGKIRRVRTLLADSSYASPLSLMECENPDGSRFTAALMRHRNVHRGFVKLFGRKASYEGTVYPPAHYQVKRTLGREELARDTKEAWQYLLTDFSLPAMTKFELAIETRQMPQTYDQIVEKVQVFLAMHKSLLEGGAAVDLNRLEPEWTSPNPYPGYFPDGYFAQG
jgi:predicted dehydrogenase